MTQRGEFIIDSDAQLGQFGIFTEASLLAEDDGTTVLTRQDFRDVQEEVFDTYPTDDAFVRTVRAAIELGARPGAEEVYRYERSQTAEYVASRRPSQPDFMIVVEAAAGILARSRFRETALTENGYEALKARKRLMVLREALARKSIDPIITMEEFERPMRVSGEVFVSPGWKKKHIDADPLRVRYMDFEKQAGRRTGSDYLAGVAFFLLGKRLGGEGATDSPEARDRIMSIYFGDKSKSVRWFDKEPVVFSLGLAGAYRAVTDLLEYGGGADAVMLDAESVDRALDVAHRTVIAKVPGSWFINGRFVPPAAEKDFDF